jgi:glycosyltransferase involved in cell wall biosynthesis
MRIGFIIYGSLDTLTGGYLYDKFVVEGLSGLGHDVEIIALPEVSYLRRLGQGLSTKLNRQLLAGNFDILIADELCHPSLVFVKKRLCRHPDPPLLVALVHHLLSDEPRPPWRNMLLGLVEKTFLASVDGFIHNSQTTQRKVAALAGHNRPQVIASPAGNRFGRAPLTPEEISRRSKGSGPLELLFLGILIPRKGLLPLLLALADVDRDIWRLSIVGGGDFDPDYAAQVKKLTRQLGLSQSVQFLGPLYDEDLAEILSSSHLFCMPYAYEGFGIAMLEAMSFALPALGSRTGAASETISHGTNGFLLEPGDQAALKSLLQQLHEDRKRLQQMSLAALATSCSRPGWQDCVAAIETFLCNLKESSKPQKTPE